MMLRRTQRGLIGCLHATWRHRARVPVTLSGWNLSAVFCCLILRNAGLLHCRVVAPTLRGVAHKPVVLTVRSACAGALPCARSSNGRALVHNLLRPMPRLARLCERRT